MRHIGAVALWALAAAGCAARRPASPVPAGLEDTVWYVSVRARDGGIDRARLADAAEVGLAVLRPRPADPATGRVDPIVRDSLVLGWDEFVARLQRRLARLPAADARAFWFVHGYGTALHECWQAAANAQVRARSAVPWVAFCWPSHGPGVARPGREGVFARGYRLDSARAQASRPAFARVTAALEAAVGADRLVLVAHSLGTQLAAETLASDSALRAVLATRPLRAVAWVAPDADRARFADVLLPATIPLARRTVVYVSSNDRVLALARRATGRDRAGLVGQPPVPWPAVETVDVTDAATSAGWFHRLFGTNHSLRRASGLVFDLAHVVAAGRAADCRLRLGTGTLDPSGAWRLVDRPLPAPDATASCAAHPSPPGPP